LEDLFALPLKRKEGKRLQLALQKQLHRKTNVKVSLVLKKLVGGLRKHQHLRLLKHRRQRQRQNKAPNGGIQLKMKLLMRMQDLQSQFMVQNVSVEVGV
jgi:hypothetical protein